MLRRLRLDRLKRLNRLNAALAVAVVTVIALIVWTLGSGGDSPTSSTRTASVSTGTVTASVTASGNIEAADSIEVSFEGGGGIVERIYVEEGERVRKGAKLARVDQTSAKQAVRSAEAGLASAQAQYETATQGQTAQERRRDSATVASSREGVDAAEVALDAAEDTYRLDKSQQNGNVSRADDAVEDAEDAYESAQQAYANNPSDANAQAVATARTNLTSAKSSLQSAKNTRDSLLLQDRQTIDSREESLDSARAGLTSAKASASVNAQGGRKGAIDAARAQIASAQVTLDEANTTLDQTVLRAPSSGTIANISGVQGQSSSSVGGSSDASSGDSGSSGSGSSDSNSSSSSSSSSGGFITMKDVDVLEVTASVAEADINDVKVGQPAAVALSASSKEVSGEVAAIDLVQTVTNNVVEYGVTIRLEGDKEGVKLGQSSDVTVTTATKQNVLRAPSSALTTVGDRTTATVQQKDGSTRTVQVQTGVEGDAQTEVISGLKAGDTVVIPTQEGGAGGFTFPGGGLGRVGGGP